MVQPRRQCTLLAVLLNDLARTPRLPGAACRNHAALFDATTVPHSQDARRRAVAICAGCPALAACRDWLHSLPAGKRPQGVVAGEVIASTGRLVVAQRRRTTAA